MLANKAVGLRQLTAGRVTLRHRGSSSLVSLKKCSRPIASQHVHQRGLAAIRSSGLQQLPEVQDRSARLACNKTSISLPKLAKQAIKTALLVPLLTAAVWGDRQAIAKRGANVQPQVLVAPAPTNDLAATVRAKLHDAGETVVKLAATGKDTVVGVAVSGKAKVVETVDLTVHAIEDQWFNLHPNTRDRLSKPEVIAGGVVAVLVLLIALRSATSALKSAVPPSADAAATVASPADGNTGSSSGSGPPAPAAAAKAGAVGGAAPTAAAPAPAPPAPRTITGLRAETPIGKVLAATFEGKVATIQHAARTDTPVPASVDTSTMRATMQHNASRPTPTFGGRNEGKASQNAASAAAPLTPAPAKPTGASLGPAAGALAPDATRLAPNSAAAPVSNPVARSPGTAPVSRPATPAQPSRTGGSDVLDNGGNASGGATASSPPSKASAASPAVGSAGNVDRYGAVSFRLEGSAGAQAAASRVASTPAGAGAASGAAARGSGPASGSLPAPDEPVAALPEPGQTTGSNKDSHGRSPTNSFAVSNYGAAPISKQQQQQQQPARPAAASPGASGTKRVQVVRSNKGAASPFLLALGFAAAMVDEFSGNKPAKSTTRPARPSPLPPRQDAAGFVEEEFGEENDAAAGGSNGNSTLGRGGGGSSAGSSERQNVSTRSEAAGRGLLRTGSSRAGIFGMASRRASKGAAARRNA